jgi:putative transposase
LLHLKKLKKEQRSLSRKFQKGKEQSNNYRKQRLKVTKIHEKISNQRKDYLHKLTTINDCGWGMFRQMLEYKVKDLRVIGRFSPSSKICNVCGDVNKDLKLSDRNWTCSNGHELDRDVNAAINIKKFGLRVSTLQQNVSGCAVRVAEPH